MGAQRVSRHNGRSGKSGAYSSKHNDRQFDADKTEHINTERMLHNVYWDYQNGLRTHAEQESGSYPTFAEIEKQFYTEQYSDFLTGQHERNRKAGHSNRDRSVEDLLRDKRVCPEETIYQIGKEGSETPPEVLLEVIQDYHARFNQQFGEHVHIIDWALHLDETTPHVHERHVFDMKNSHGEIEPKQEKTLELMGIPLPEPERKPGQYNNRKKTFDSVCRNMFIETCKEHGLSIEEEPIYGGQAYREKNDYIIESQQAEIVQQQQMLNSQLEQQAQISQLLTQQQAQIINNRALLEDEERLIAKVSAEAYDKAVNLIAEETVREVQSTNAQMLTGLKEKTTSQDKRMSPRIRETIIEHFDQVISYLLGKTSKLITHVRQWLLSPEVRSEHVRKMKNEMAPSIHEQLELFRRKRPEAARSTIRKEDRSAR